MTLDVALHPRVLLPDSSSSPASHVPSTPERSAGISDTRVYFYQSRPASLFSLSWGHTQRVDGCYLNVWCVPLLCNSVNQRIIPIESFLDYCTRIYFFSLLFHLQMPSVLLKSHASHTATAQSPSDLEPETSRRSNFDSRSSQLRK